MIKNHYLRGMYKAKDDIRFDTKDIMVASDLHGHFDGIVQLLLPRISRFISIFSYQAT